MTKDELEEVIKAAFLATGQAFKTNKEKKGAKFDSCGSHILFPRKRKTGEIRVSEQELRFVFVEKLNKYINGKDVFYSVETPTEHAYRGFKKGQPEVADDDRNAQSGNIDLCIHNKEGKRICLIEFKALNPKAADYSKDFLKLKEEAKEDKEVLRYFLQIIKVVNDKTIKNIAEEKLKYFDKPIEYRCYSLDSRKPGNIEKDILEHRDKANK